MNITQEMQIELRRIQRLLDARSEGEALDYIVRVFGNILDLFQGDNSVDIISSKLKANLALNLNPNKEILTGNRKLENCLAGGDAFIVASGPSVNAFELMKLPPERTIFVSNAFMHSDYDRLKPQFYCIPSVTTSGGHIHELDSYLNLILTKTQHANRFFSIADHSAIDKNSTGPEGIYFYSQHSEVKELSESGLPIDFTKSIPNFQSVSVLATMLALYLGASNIYLIGIEHSDWQTGKYSYFYERDEVSRFFTDPSVDSKGKCLDSNFKQLGIYLKLFTQHALLDAYAKKRGARIYNLSHESALDVYEFHHEMANTYRK